MEVEDVLHVSPAPRINRLGVIPHHHQAILVAHQLINQTTLDRIGVLVFVHENIAELPLVQRPQVWIVAQESKREYQQVVKVHAIGL